jgi:phage tail sheath gpL-like
MSVTVTTRERPGVYSVYDASSLVRSNGVKNVVLLAKDGGSADGTQVSVWHTYTQVVEKLGEKSVMAELVRVLLLNGAAAVYGIPVSEDGQYAKAIETAGKLENIGVVVCDSTDLTVQQAVRDGVAEASGARMERIAVLPGGVGEETQALCERAEALNSERVVLVGPEAVGMDGTAAGCVLCAAAVAGAIAGEGDPAVPLGGAVLKGLNGLNVRWSDNEIDTLVRGGVTPLESMNGSISVVRGITTRTKTGEEEDTSWRELSTVLIVDEVIPGIRSALRSRFQRTKNTQQSRNAIRSQVILELESRINREIITGYENVSVAALEGDPTVCLVEFAFTVAHGLNQIWISAHITI